MLKNVLSSIKLKETGVFVQASTLGSLEALLEFLRTSKIPYAGISIGPVHKKDISMASIMLEKDSQYAVILAFDVKVEREAQDMADHLGVKIFTADIIYHLFDKFMGYRDELKQKKKEEFKDIAVFPFKIKILPQFIFNTRDPIIIGVKVEAGFLKIGSPVCAMCEDVSALREGKDKFVDLGRISSIEVSNKPVEIAKTGQEVCIKIENTTNGAPKLLGRHFLVTDFLVSKISRESIDAVKNYFREEMSKSDWQLIIELKKQFQIL
jgi:translation initiation factor 5B